MSGIDTARLCESEPKVSNLAEVIVQLIAKKTLASLKEAIALVNDAYPDNPALASRAYEIACTVVAKRGLAKAPLFKKGVLICPEADLLAIQASEEIAQGELVQGFSHLHSASLSGVQRSLCRSVSWQLLRALGNTNRLTILSYGGGGGIEVGSIDHVGVILLQTHPPNGSAGQVSLKTWDQVTLALNDDSPRPEVSKARASLTNTDWRRYFFALSAGSAR